MLLAVSMTSFAQQQYAHPGIDLTQEELDRIKTNVNAYKQPWLDGWNKLLAERDAQSDFKASPKSTVGGSNGTRQRAERDANAAYYNILRWQGRRIKLRCPPKVLTGTLHPSLPSIFSG